jgi:MFS family permease
MQFLPMLGCGLYGGVIADRYPKRQLLLITQSVACVLAASLAVLTLAHLVTVWQVWLIAFLLGVVTVVDNPARQIFVNEMVESARLRNAISINSSVFQLGGLVGPGISGVLITAVGGGWAFAVNTLTYLPVIVALLHIDVRQLRAGPGVSAANEKLRETLRHVRGHPVLIWPIVLGGFFGMFALNMPILLSAFAKNVFHTGAGGYGLLSSMVALGSLVGSLRSATRPGSRLRSIVAAAALAGALEAAAPLAPNQVVFCVLLIGVGAAAVTFLTIANACVQTSSSDEIRGRVMSIYLLVLIGGTPIGGPITGLLTSHLGVRLAMFVCGIVPAVTALVVGVVIAHRSDLALDVRVQLSIPPTRFGIVGRTRDTQGE